MLFATQNPPGLYGGRKTLSRAFRNRFLELHFDDIPEDELEYILEHRSRNVAPSDCKRIVTVYKELSRLRQSNRLFEQKDSFATLRDLFRWASRNADNREQLAANGYMLLAERVRKPEERSAVKEIIEKVMKVKLDPNVIYDPHSCPEIELYNNTANTHGVVWNNAMRRLYILVAHALRNNEPVLLVGDTGCSSKHGDGRSDWRSEASQKSSGYCEAA
jgi:midasin